jgi:excisionase family DNA binding protein
MNTQSQKDILAHETLLTPDEAAARLKVTSEQVRSLIRKGRLSAINVGTGKKRSLYRITQCSLNKFLGQTLHPGPIEQKKKFKRLPPVPDFIPHLK